MARQAPRAEVRLVQLEEEYSSQPLEEDEFEEEVQIVRTPPPPKSYAKGIANAIEVMQERTRGDYFHMAVASATISGKTYLLSRLAKRMLDDGTVERVFVLTRNEISAQGGYPFASILPFSDENLQIF